MFLQTVVADGNKEQQILNQMKQRASETRTDIENIVKSIMDDVRKNGLDAVEKYSLQFDKTKPYIIEQSVIDKAYN